jgi:hypothetical protein
VNASTKGSGVWCIGLAGFCGYQKLDLPLSQAKIQNIVQ